MRRHPERIGLADEQALAQLQKTETLFPAFPNKDWLLFFTGLSYVELKQPQFARQYLQRLIAQYPNSSLRKAAEKLLNG